MLKYRQKHSTIRVLTESWLENLVYWVWGQSCTASPRAFTSCSEDDLRTPSAADVAAMLPARLKIGSSACGEGPHISHTAQALVCQTQWWLRYV